MNGKQRAADPTGMNTLKYSSLKGYVDAICKLWRGQVARGTASPARHPRGDLVKNLLGSYQRNCDKKRRADRVDRGSNTIIDTYSHDQFKEVCRAFWGNLTTVPLGIRLRSLADFLMRHHMLLRGQSTRHADLADLFTLPDLKEGITPCQPLILTMGHGKMNQYGKMEYAGALRNKDPVICPLGALAIYLFWRWEFSGEPFPNFSHRAAWYDRKLFPPSVNAACKAAEQGEEAARCLDQGLPAERLYYGDSGDSEEEETDDSSDSESDMEEDLSGEEESDSEAEQKRCAERRLLRKRKGAPKGYSYKTQHKWMARAFSECGIKTSAVTHTGRKAGALHMEMMGLGIESIRRHGKLCKSEALNKM